MVERLLVDSGRQQAEGVVAVDQANGNRCHVKADLVVLAASTIQTIAILLRSQREGLSDPQAFWGVD